MTVKRKARATDKSTRLTVRVPASMGYDSTKDSGLVTRMLELFDAVLKAEPVEKLLSPKEQELASQYLASWITEPVELIFMTAGLTAKRHGATAEFVRRLDNLKPAELATLALWIDAKRGGSTR